MDVVVNVADALPAPACPDGLGAHCPGPFCIALASCRPGETDAVVRCGECGAHESYVLDAAGHVLDEAALKAHRAAKPAEKPGLTVSPEPTPELKHEQDA